MTFKSARDGQEFMPKQGMVSCLQLKRMGERESQCSQRLALMSYLLISLSTAAIAYTFTADVSTGSAAYALLLFHPIMCGIYTCNAAYNKCTYSSGLCTLLPFSFLMFILYIFIFYIFSLLRCYWVVF